MIGTFAIALLASSGAVEKAFGDANAAYFRGDFAAAAAGYERVAHAGGRAGAGPDVLYNLGNAYYRLGRIGPAIHTFERARLLAPNAADVAYNLRVARREAARRAREAASPRPTGRDLEGSEEDPPIERIAMAASPTLLAAGFAAAWTLAFAGLLARRALGGVARATVGAGAATLALAALALGAWLGARAWVDATVVRGIVLPDHAEAAEGPDPSYRRTFALHAGLRVRVVERDGDFVKVRAESGLEGWLPQSDVGLL